MYEYRATVLKVIDGDTVDVDIDLGFGIVLKDERVRIMGIDTPESRTRDKVEDLLGPNFFCWGSHFFCKLANESDHGFVPFHQDATYWPFDHNRTVTVWLAIDDADEENSAMNFIKGSHKEKKLKIKDVILKKELINYN